ncbi:DUF3667 domain-containing protein [Mucilaginibacter litoreus]|uniref:DUF3667 domain-containing protein n=1 Tax=Mucilaginibacter litoreus TaxID=1048221 RepID=A0ABW3ALY2_9SPHI
MEETVLKYEIKEAIGQCGTCKSPLTGKFCSSCGQPSKLPRVDSHYILHELQHILHFEKGILYTIKELLIRPGQNVKEFITDNRSRLVKPVIFIIVTSLVYSAVSHFFELETGYINYQGNKHTAINAIFSWISSHYGYANIIMGLFIASWLKLLFKRQGYNVFEILIVLCFVMGMMMLILALFTLFAGITKFNIMGLAGIICMGYSTWAIGQFFDHRKPGSYFKALAAYILGMITFSLAVVFLGIIIDLGFKS